MLHWLGIVFACALIFVPVWGAASPEGSVRGGLVLDVQSAWSPGDGATRPTHRWHLERPGASLRVVVDEPGRGAALNYGIPLRLDPVRTPILSLTYRAEGLRTDDPDAVVLAFWSAPFSIVPVVRQRELVVDGQVHTARIDLLDRLREAGFDPSSLPGRIDLRVQAANDRPGSLELIDLRFEPAAGEEVPTVAPADGELAEPVRVLVVDETGEPVPDAVVILDPHLRDLRVSEPTDAEGRAIVRSAHPALPDTRRALRIWKDGHVDVLFTDLQRIGRSTELAAVLARADTVGGRVVDDAGDPVHGAVGRLLISGAPDQDARGHPHRESPLLIRADQDGRWISPPLPRSGALAVQVLWVQPGYLYDQSPGEYSGTLTMDDLRAHRATSVLRRGIAIAGRVTDRQGKPIAHALVAQGKRRHSPIVPSDTLTDSDGRYHFENIPDGQLVLTVTADGCAPRIATTEAYPGMAPIDFVLEPAATFRFRVVDDDGNPLPGALIGVDRWQGFHTLPGLLLADAHGEATWQGPQDPVTFAIIAPGKRPQDGAVFAPSRDESDVHEVVLQDALHIAILAADARSGSPLGQFHVTHAILSQSPAEAPYWQQPSPTDPPGRDGRWDTVFMDRHPYLVFRVEAEGYAPAVTEPVAAMGEGRLELSVQMEPAEARAYTLADPSGAPVGDTKVYVSTGGQMPTIRDGRVDSSHGVTSCRTDSNGRFTMPPQGDQRFLLIACTDAGYLEIEGADLPLPGETITLPPWATVTGTLRVGDRLGSNELVSVHRRFVDSAGQRFPHHLNQATTDAAGCFRFDRVPAGPVGVSHMAAVSDTSWRTMQGKTTEALPGETVEVHIGGVGRPVVGRYVWPEGTEPAGATSQTPSLGTHVDREALQAVDNELLPVGAEDWDLDRRIAFLGTDAGKAYQEERAKRLAELRKDDRYYGCIVREDGSFRFDDVLPGRYVLNQSVRAATRNIGIGDEIGRHQMEVNVPALPEGVTYLPEPIDLGTLTMQPVKKPLPVGAVTPDFTVRVLDPDAEDPGVEDPAARFTLSDHRGKVVLVDFWATWCGPCIAETPHLKAVWEEFGSHPRFTMIGLSLDQKPDAPAKYAKQNNLQWIQGFLGAASASPVPDAYGVQGIPTILVIGPDGKVFRTGLRGAEIHAAVANALEAL